MNLKNQMRIAADILKASPKRVWFDPEWLDEIKESITKADLRALIKDNAIKVKPKRGISRGRVKKIRVQKRKRRRRGIGSRKGRSSARLSNKSKWVNKIRTQRNFINLLRDKKLVYPRIYRDLYRKAKGNFFRSKRHIQLYMKEHNLFVKDGKK
jgi:large subunit ribosomal protein L19e